MMKTRAQEMLDLARTQVSYAEIGARFGISKQRVGFLLKRAGFAPGSAGRMPRGSGHPKWRGGKTRCAGYVMVHRPGHHRAGHRGYVFEHILVAEEMLGRPITRAEHVHHKNSDRADNRPENLEVLTPAQHRRLHGRWDRPALIRVLLAAAAKVGDTPTLPEIEANGPPHANTFYRWFGSYANACRAAGLKPYGRGGAGHRVHRKAS